MEVWFGALLKNSPHVLTSFVHEVPGLYISSSSLYNATLHELFLRRYTIDDAFFVLYGLKRAFRWLLKRGVCHTDSSPSNVLVRFDLKRDEEEAAAAGLLRPPVRTFVKNVVLADFSSAIDVRRSRSARQNLRFGTNTLTFSAPATTLLVRPPEFLQNTVTYTKCDIFKLDSWAFGILCALCLHYCENRDGRYHNLISRITDIPSPHERDNALWTDVYFLKQETLEFKRFFHRNLLPIQQRAFVS